MPRKSATKTPAARKKRPAIPAGSAKKSPKTPKAAKTTPHSEKKRKRAPAASRPVASAALDSFLKDVIGNPSKLERLLAAEKKRRGVDKDDLVFVGMHNVAQYYWCAYHSLWKSEDNELVFFHAYLIDRLRFSYLLGRLRKLPRTTAEILDTGDDIGVDEIWNALKPYQRQMAAIQRMKQLDALSAAREPGRNPNFAVGERAEAVHSKILPKFRWNFVYRDFVVVGVPDGLTDDAVYEFKTTGMNTVRFILPVAQTQADLYGHFFGKPKKIVEITSRTNDCLHYEKSAVDSKRATETLDRLAALASGKEDAPLPVSWKCPRCEYVDECSYSQA